MDFVLSRYPMTTLLYLADEHKRVLKQAALLRQDRILGAIDSAGALRTMFNDYISCFSPLSSRVGDAYYLASTSFLNQFMVR